MPPVGFVLLVNPFNALGQSVRLIQTLNLMFDDPPIACHHDFGKNPRFIEDCPANVRLVRPHVDTKWGDFSCVDAMIRALRLLYEGGEGPHWFVFLSGSDYPIKPAATILRELAESEYDGHVEHRLLSPSNFAYPMTEDSPQTWKGKDWLRLCYRRYCARRVDLPGINRHLRPSKRTLWLEHQFFTKGRLPFTPEFKCYAGEVWFSANHRCARSILDFYDTDRRVTAHYRKTLVPEESYLQTILANDPKLTLSQNFLRYVDWTRGTSNPRLLTAKDLPHLARSGAHFARKFTDHGDTRVLDIIDEMIGLNR